MTTPQTVTTVVATAQSLGVDPLAALADAYQESGLVPTAVGDQGTSYGLFQLHRGGELGSLSPAQAFDPATNAKVALSQFASVAKANPGLSAGALAAAAERPANPGPYAASVQGKYQALSATAGQPPPASSSGFGSWLSRALKAIGDLGKAGVDTATGNLPGAAGAAAGAVGQVAGGIASGLVSGWGADALKIGLEIVFVVAALGLLLVGLTRMFPSLSRTVTTVVGDTTGAAAHLAAA